MAMNLFLSKTFKNFIFRRRSSSSIEDGIDKSIDEALKQSALRNNLTDQEVKKILTVSTYFD